MCIAYFALRAHSEWPIFIAANRDEFHDRPTQAAAPWPDHPDVIAGIDLLGNGTWLGISRTGRFAFLTNYRDMSSEQQLKTTRGALVSDYLCSDVSPDVYTRQVAQRGQRYNGFNLVVGDLERAAYVSNRAPGGEPHALDAGRYVISNHLLNTAWPKCTRLKQKLDAYPLEQLEESVDPVFDILNDPTQASDALLPDTGLSIERERLLSSPFIVSPTYGTRSSTVVTVHVSGKAYLREISYDALGRMTERHDWPFEITPG